MTHIFSLRISIYIAVSTIILSCGTSEYPKKITENFTIDYDGNGNLHLMNTNNLIVIEGDIVEYEDKGKFIVLKQQPINKILDSIQHKTNKTYNLKDRRNILEISKTFDFWVIHKFDNSLAGPLKKEELELFMKKY
ncbi:MAG TPA: hypothetical protein VLZ11_06875 [Flavobacterium sp.]|nr:hypothetical protein [Flavobacterium sp.]